MPKKYETELVPRSARTRRKERTYAAIGMVVAACLCTGAVRAEGDTARGLWFYGALLAVIAALLLANSFRATERTLSAAGATLKAADEAAAKKRSDEFWERWYMRYLIAAGCFAIAWFILADDSSSKSNETARWFWAAIFACIGAWKAREIARPALYLAIGVGAVLLLVAFLSSATISVPGAIIIGSLIIAAAIRSKEG